jgi:hypothetical protein
MIARISLVLNLMAAFFKSESRLEAENAAFRLQLIVLQRKLRGRRRHWYGGTVLGFVAIGAESLGPREVGRRSAGNCGH